MTNQEAFDRVAKHLFAQKQRCLRPIKSILYEDPVTVCSYRNAIGQKCAIGALIPDELYKPSYESMRIDSLLVKEEAMTELFKGTSVALLIDLQAVHDGFSQTDLKQLLDSWRHSLQVVASRYDLSKQDMEQAYVAALEAS